MRRWVVSCSLCGLQTHAADSPALLAAELLLEEHGYTEHGLTRLCGTRAKFVHDRCRCTRCSRANRVWAQENSFARSQDWVDLVDATSSRERLLLLSRAGVGRRQVSALTGLGPTAIFKITHEETRRIRRSTRDRILAVDVDDVAAGQYIDATQAWQDIDDLQALGYPKAWISAKIGNNGRSLQLGRSRCTRRNADAIRRLRIVVGDLRYDERSEMTVEDESRLTGERAERVMSSIPRSEPPERGAVDNPAESLA